MKYVYRRRIILVMHQFLQSNFKIVKPEIINPEASIIPALIEIIDFHFCLNCLPVHVKFEIVKNFTLQTYHPSHVLIENNYNHDTLYIIHEGIVEENEIERLKLKRKRFKYKNCVINDVGFFCPDEISTKSYVIKEKSRLWAINRSKFEDILMIYENDVITSFQTMKENVTMYEIISYYIKSIFKAQLTFENTSLFRYVPREDLSKLIEICEMEVFKEKDIIIHQKNTIVPNPKFFVIGSGSVDIFIDGKYVNRIGQGEYFGELSFIDEITSYSIIACSKLTLFSFNHDAFEHILQPLHAKIFKYTDDLSRSRSNNSKERDIASLASSFNFSDANDIIFEDDEYYEIILHLFDQQDVIKLNVKCTDLNLFYNVFDNCQSIGDKPMYFYTFKIIDSSDTHTLYLMKTSFLAENFILKRIKKQHTEVNDALYDTCLESMMIHSKFCVQIYGIFEDHAHIYIISQKMDYNLEQQFSFIDTVLDVEKADPSCGLCKNLSLKKEKHIVKKEIYVVFYIACIIQALEYLHLNGVVFRNVKPENILFDRDGYAYLSNYEFIEYIGKKQKTRTFIGTPGFMSPEIVNRERYGFEADYWALGCTMYYILMNDNPFNNPKTNNIIDLIDRSRNPSYQIKFSGYVSKEVKDFITKLLRNNINERLGARSKSMFENIYQIKQHPCFNWINWRLLQNRQYEIQLNKNTLDLQINEDF